MRWKDFSTTEYKKLDITLEKTSDVQFLSLLHDAYFDPAEIPSLQPFPSPILIQTGAILTVNGDIAVVFQQICNFFADSPAVTSRKNHILHRIPCVISGKYAQCKTPHPERCITAVRIKNFE